MHATGRASPKNKSQEMAGTRKQDLGFVFRILPSDMTISIGSGKGHGSDITIVTIFVPGVQCRLSQSEELSRRAFSVPIPRGQYQGHANKVTMVSGFDYVLFWFCVR